jgi:tricorn protease-like protein
LLRSSLSIVSALALTRKSLPCLPQRVIPLVLRQHPLKGQRPQFIQPPAALTFGQIGSAAFSPDSRRVAYALARGEASNEQGWLVVSDGVSGGSRLIGQSQPQAYFSVLGWLDSGTILVQSLSTAGPVQTGAIWLARADGGGLTKLADGTFMALLPGSPQ